MDIKQLKQMADWRNREVLKELNMLLEQVREDKQSCEIIITARIIEIETDMQEVEHL